MKLFDKCIENIDNWFDAFNKFGATGNKIYEELMQTYAIKVDKYILEIEEEGLSYMFYNEILNNKGYTRNNINFIRGVTKC